MNSLFEFMKVMLSVKCGFLETGSVSQNWLSIKAAAVATAEVMSM